METPTPAAPVSTPAPTTTDAPTPPTPAPETPAAPAPETKKEPDAVTPPTPEPTIDELLAQVDITKMSDTQIADIESGNPERIKSALGVKGEGTTPEATKPTQTPPVPTSEDGDLKRISLKALKASEDRAAIAEAVQLVRDGKAANIKDALAQVFQFGTSPAPASTETSPSPAAPVVDATVKEIEDKIAALTEERKAARDAYDYDKSESIGDQIADLKLDLRDAKRDAATRAEQSKASASTQAQWEKSESESRSRALDKYGEQMSDPESSFSDYLEVEIALAERKNDNILSQPDWPEKIADRVNAKYFGGNGAAQSTPQPQASQIPPAPPPGVRLPGSPVGNGAQTVALTAAAAAAELESLSPEQRRAVLERAQLAVESRR